MQPHSWNLLQEEASDNHDGVDSQKSAEEKATAAKHTADESETTKAAATETTMFKP